MNMCTGKDMSDVNGSSPDSVVRACAWCDMPLPKRRVKGERFCSRKCKTKMKRLLAWSNRSDPVRQVPWPPHYIQQWAWQVTRVRFEGAPGNIFEYVRGWERRRFLHD